MRGLDADGGWFRLGLGLGARGEGVIKVEVKGTTTDSAKVGLTHKEVKQFGDGYPDNALAFVWTKTAEQILQSIQRLMKRINGAGTPVRLRL